MSARFDPDRFADEPEFADDVELPIDEWTVDELDRSADLVSLRSAWMRGDDPNE